MNPDKYHALTGTSSGLASMASADSMAAGRLSVGVWRVRLPLAMLMFGIWLLAPAVSGQAQTPPAELLAATCAGCHGTDGNSNGPAAPTISGMTYAYFVLSMEDYQLGRRNSTIMKRIARGYKPDEIQAMAAYFSSQPFMPIKQKHDATKVGKGRSLHMRYCNQCHQDGGRKAGRAGVLYGQLRSYLKLSLDDMMTGKRRMPSSMKLWVRRLVRIEGKDAIDTLLEYYASRTQ